MDHLPTPKFGPLAGLRIVSLGTKIVGPLAEQMFIEWGAEVIWVENVVWAGIVYTRPNYLQLSRRDLHALSLNILKDEGREVFLKLTKTADIFIRVSEGPAFARHGITDEALWQHNPKLTIARLPGFDRYGVEEYTSFPVYNTIIQVFSGYLIQNDDVDQPMPTSPYTADCFSDLTATAAALAAPHKVRETGKGESIDIAMCEVMLRMGQYFMIDYFNDGEMCPRMTRGKDPYYASCGPHKYADGYIVMELVSVTQITKCFKDIGLTYLLDTPEIPEGTQFIYRTEYPYGPLVEEKLDAQLTAHTTAEVKERFTELDIACAKVLTVSELENNPQYLARESVTQWQAMDGRARRGSNIMPKFRNSPGQI